MAEQGSLESQLIEAFEMMWGKYNEPVRLINRKFDIIAINEAYKAIGGAAGTKCNATSPEMHKGCKAMAALKTNETQIVVSEKNGVVWTSFWIPVSGHPDYFIHFTNGMTEYIKKLNSN